MLAHRPWLLGVCLCWLLTAHAVQAQAGYALQNLTVEVAETDNCLVLTWEARQAQQPEDQCPFYQLYRRQGEGNWAPIQRLEAVGYTQQAYYVFQDCNYCYQSGGVAYRVEYVADISGICDETALDTLFTDEISLAEAPCVRAASACAEPLIASTSTAGIQLSYCVVPAARAAWLEAFDVAGRKVWQWDIPLLGGGIGTTGRVRWEPELAAAMYLIILRDDLGNVRVTKVLH